jgi:DNA replication protein DnaC
LATNLGVTATKNGFDVAKVGASTPAARLRARRYFNCGLLIIAELGFLPLDRLEANLFFRLASAQFERGSMLLTSNKHVSDWPEIFAGAESFITAILNRLLHCVSVIHIDGWDYRSNRLREPHRVFRRLV